jgi:hypothetical protein
MKLQVFTAADKICATNQGGALLTLGHKFEKNLKTALAFSFYGAILKANGCGNPVPIAAVAHQLGGSLNIFDDFFESVGRCVCTGVTIGTFSTPAGSFFVSGVETGGKSHKLTNRRLKCVNAPTTPSAKDTQSPLLLSFPTSRRLFARLGSNDSILSAL